MDKIETRAAFEDEFDHRYMTKPQVCGMLGITLRTLEGWMRRGHVPYYKIGRWVRFLEEDIHAHLKSYRVQRSNGLLPNRRSKKLENAAASLADLEVA